MATTASRSEQAIRIVEAVKAPLMPDVRTSLTRVAALAPATDSLAALRLAVPNTVTSMARPSDPPTCCMTFTRLDAAPLSRGSTPERARTVSATNGKPTPKPNKLVHAISVATEHAPDGADQADRLLGVVIDGLRPRD